MFIGGGICNKWNKDEEVDYFYKGYGKNVDINRKLCIKYFNEQFESKNAVDMALGT